MHHSFRQRDHLFFRTQTVDTFSVMNDSIHLLQGSIDYPFIPVGLIAEMIPLAEAVMQTEAILEEWIPKEQLQGENYDLRVVCRESEIDYIVVRCSKGSITNLHLNNKAHWWNELSLPEVVRQQIYFQCQEAVQSLDLQYAGVDVLIERGTDIPYIIEVNGQGDHVYQDMFAHNSIYIQQIKNIKKRYNHANR